MDEGPVALYVAAWPVGRKPVGTSGCIYRYFTQKSVVCDGGGTECTYTYIAVHMGLEILFCWSVLKVPLCCALGHIHVYCLGYAVRMATVGYCFWCIGYVLGNVSSSCALFVRWFLSKIAVNTTRCTNWFMTNRSCSTLPSHRTYFHTLKPNKPVGPQLATSQQLKVHATHTKNC
jgi:hypothetical protein